MFSNVFNIVITCGIASVMARESSSTLHTAFYLKETPSPNPHSGFAAAYTSNPYSDTVAS